MSDSSATVESTVNTLVEMGFPRDRAMKALGKTGFAGVEAAMEWMLQNPDNGKDEDEEDEDQEQEEEANKPPPRVLTAEEREIKVKELEELRVKKRREREEREAADALEKEKKRISDGKAMTEIKQRMADQEIRKAAEERRREKLETKAAKERVKAQIEADRRARKEREEEERRRQQGGETDPVQSTPAAVAVQPPQAKPAEPGKYESARIQMRLPDNTALVQTFNSKEPLSAVRLYVDMNRKDGVAGPAKLMTTFPKKIFSEQDYETPLESLGLVPSAVVIVTK